MKKIFAILLSALALGGCENDGIPYVSLGLDDLYKVARMQTVDLKPAFTGESYRWTVKTASGADSLLSEEKDYIFLMQYPGTYDVTFQIFDPVNPIVHRMTFYVVEEEVEYSPYISTVYEYCPAPGQFVNAMPEYREGDTAETMRQKAEEAIAGKMQSGVSLGAYGGYITFGFDHTVVNVRASTEAVRNRVSSWSCSTRTKTASLTTSGTRSTRIRGTRMRRLPTVMRSPIIVPPPTMSRRPAKETTAP